MKDKLHWLAMHGVIRGIAAIGIRRGFVERDDWCETDALRVVDLIAHGTAARIYRLGDR